MSIFQCRQMCRGNVVQSTTKILSELRTSLGGVGLAVLFVLGPRPESPTRPTLMSCLCPVVGLRGFSFQVDTII